MRRRMPRRLAAALALGLLVGACGSGGLPATHYYTLRAPTETPSSGADDSGLVVGVRSFAVDPPYDQDRLVYREGREATEVGFYAYHRWASPLGRLVSVALAEGLQGTPGIAAIEPARAASDYTARLDGRVLYLEEVDTTAGQEVRLSMELTLSDSEDESLWSAVLTSSASGQAGAVSQIAELAQRAFDDVLRQASAGIETALRNRSAAVSPL